jgi:kinetochore protein NDC80
MVNVKDVDRMRREMQAIEDDIANAEKGKAALEDKVWEVEAKLVTKLEELERHADQCNQALKKYEHAAASPIFSKFYFSILLEIDYRYT